MPPSFAGIHHLKFAVSAFAPSLEFYARVFGARRIPELDHRRPDGFVFAVIVEFPHLGTFLELRLDPAAAAAQEGFDPVTLAVATRADLDLWAAHLDAVGVAHSPVLAGTVGWVLIFEDPDGRRLRFYTIETHGPEVPFILDPRWMG